MLLLSKRWETITFQQFCSELSDWTASDKFICLVYNISLGLEGCTCLCGWVIRRLTFLDWKRKIIFNKYIVQQKITHTEQAVSVSKFSWQENTYTWIITQIYLRLIQMLVRFFVILDEVRVLSRSFFNFFTIFQRIILGHNQ